ncbi:class I SAM-dependent methyltransferase [Paenibacillus cremeus]|uniref:Methyltransferase domain-containing protein n=1 Tax=Paenibacillus cremeus TaxID=2163881 RepID=A0A559K9R5_9BACL|nr:methyltransferase [Paenibacillus cremeus]TVY08877.1 methyltransferase domain-containing protein [Paenibacillus cremeus]
MAAGQPLLFLQKFITNPKEIGSIIPSSRFLSQKMVQSVPWQDIRTVAELGSGTGAVTQLIQASSAASTQVFLFEKDRHMLGNLAKQYPDYHCHSNACQLLNVIERSGVSQLDCIISGLPFFNFHPELRDELIHQIMQSLKPGGYFVAFQYSLQMKKQFSHVFEIEQIHFVPFNFPPAFVYVCRK